MSRNLKREKKMFQAMTLLELVFMAEWTVQTGQNTDFPSYSLFFCLIFLNVLISLCYINPDLQLDEKKQGPKKAS